MQLHRLIYLCLVAGLTIFASHRSYAQSYNWDILEAVPELLLGDWLITKYDYGYVFEPSSVVDPDLIVGGRVSVTESRLTLFGSSCDISEVRSETGELYREIVTFNKAMIPDEDIKKYYKESQIIYILCTSAPEPPLSFDHTKLHYPLPPVFRGFEAFFALYDDATSFVTLGSSVHGPVYILRPINRESP